MVEIFIIEGLSFIDFACYAAFFPQLVAGPIVRAGHFRKEIDALESNDRF